MNAVTCSHQVRMTLNDEGCLLCYRDRLRHEEEAARWTSEWHRRWEWERAILCPVCSGPETVVLSTGARACQRCGAHW